MSGFMRHALWWLLPAVLVGAASADEREARLRAKLAGLAETSARRAQIGVCVMDVRDGRVLFEQDARRPLKPASVLKLFTTAAALEHLGDDFAYETRVYERDGELLIVGSGDPGLGDERLAALRGRPLHFEYEELAAALRERGIGRLRTIALDDSVFDRDWRHADWPADQHANWYQAPIGGLNFNDNCVDAKAVAANGGVTLKLRPPLPTEFVENRLSAGRKASATVTRDAGRDVLRFRGVVARNSEFSPVAVNDPTIFFGFALRSALGERGIAPDAGVVRRTLDARSLTGAALLLDFRTPLREVLWRANTFSQNMFADCLLKSLAAYDAGGQRSARPGSWEGGAAATLATLQRIGVETGGMVLRDGSGLSHENRVTARQVAQLLTVMQQGRHAGAFAASLAQAGADGTMRNRFKEAHFRGRLIGKTGTIRGVSTLAGYVLVGDKPALAFAVLVNGGNGTDLPEAVARELVQNAGP